MKWLTLVPAGLCAALLAGAGSAPARPGNGCPVPCSGQNASPADAKLLFVQPTGERGALLAYDTRTGKQRFALPAGISTTDGRWHVSAETTRGRTVLTRWYVSTGGTRRGVEVPGRWRLAGISPDGRLVALSRRDGTRTTIRMVDMRRLRPRQTVSLRGDFEVETISADGERLFLIQHLRELGSPRYLVRLYDLSRDRLRAQPLRAKGEDRLMTGYAWSGIGSPDGRWLLTLYLNTEHNHAFVHALDLERSIPACIDLPSSGGLETLRRYVLTLSPDGRRLYAANAALGVVAEIDLRTRRVARTATFPRAGQEGRAGRATLAGTISRDGRRLFFSDGRDLWRYDAARGLVRGPLRTGGALLGFGFGRGDSRVYALRKDGRMLAFAAATGSRLR